MKVRLHIERLVLDGIDVPPGARRTLRQSLERELARRIAAGGLSSELASGIAVPSVSAPAIDTAPAKDARKLGAAIARSVYTGIGGRR